MYITNEVEVARIADDSGVDWVFIDLESIGKTERQGHLDTVISRHKIEDIKKVKRVLKHSELLVRVNPIYVGSKVEIEQVISNGADIVMLPFFKTIEEVERFIGYVSDNAKTCILLETPEAVELIDDILEIQGIDYVHIGLNDLHIGYGMDFMFELLENGTVEVLCNKISNKKIEYGFGGIAKLGHGILPAEDIIVEHIRLGSSMVILSRSFCDTKKIKDLNIIEDVFKVGVTKIRDFVNVIEEQDFKYLEKKKEGLNLKINEICKGIRGNKNEETHKLCNVTESDSCNTDH